MTQVSEFKDMSALSQQSGPSKMPGASADPSYWYAVHTRSRHEKKVAAEFNAKSINAFVPTVRQSHNWCDRRKVVEVPLFSCYVFVRVTAWKQVHWSVLQTPGVFRWVGSSQGPTVIPDVQIEAVRAMLASDLAVSPHPFLKLGQRVRVRGGCLDGIEGILIASSNNRRLVISINSIQQSLSVSLEGYDVIAA